MKLYLLNTLDNSTSIEDLKNIDRILIIETINENILSIFIMLDERGLPL